MYDARLLKQYVFDISDSLGYSRKVVRQMGLMTERFEGVCRILVVRRNQVFCDDGTDQSGSDNEENSSCCCT